MDARDREREQGKWYDSFNQQTMTITVVLENDDEEEYEATFPAMFEVCELCGGKSSHVNPGIDAHGISAEEFYDDPDFAEEYFGGTYDETCYRCKGRRVEPMIDESHLSQEQKDNLKRLEDKQESDAEYWCECEMERKMGAWRKKPNLKPKYN